MKKKLIILLSIVMCLAFTGCRLIGSESASETDGEKKEDPTSGFIELEGYVKTIRDEVNIYRTPDEKGEIYMTLNKGVDLKRTGSKNGWVRVRLNDILCYVNGKDVEETTIKWASETDVKTVTHVIYIDPAKQIEKDDSLEPLRPDLKISDIAETSTSEENNEKSDGDDTDTSSKKADSSLAKAAMGPSAIGVTTGNFEYDITFAIADKVRKELENMGYTVILSRESDSVNISNSKRALDAVSSEAEIYIRISAGSSKNADLKGMAGFIATDSNPNTKNYYNKSYDLCNLMLDKATKSTGAKNLGLFKTDELTSLNYCTTMPAVSINVGYLSNVDDDTSLSNEEYVNKVSDALTDAVLEYFTGRNLTE